MSYKLTNQRNSETNNEIFDLTVIILVFFFSFQAQSWPIAMKDRDLISIAKTGSGKTLAFLLPAFKKMDAR